MEAPRRTDHGRQRWCRGHMPPCSASRLCLLRSFSPSRALPSLWGLFAMYAGPWSSRFPDDRMVALLLVYFGLALAAVLSGWLLWEMRKAGAVLNLGLLPVEAICWVGFALHIPWFFGIARFALVALAWPELSGSRR